MSKRNKSDEITALMRSIPTAPTVSDDYVASLLAAEAAKRSERMSRLGLLSHTGTAAAATKEINKTFLANTIRGVESHNRREEIADCWRQHAMQKKIYPSSLPRHRGRLESEERSAKRGRVESCVRDYDLDRAHWAALKQEKMAVASTESTQVVSTSAAGNVGAPVLPLHRSFVPSSSSLSIDSDETRFEVVETKHRKKSKKRKDERKGKSKKERRERKASKKRPCNKHSTKISSTATEASVG